MNYLYNYVNNTQIDSSNIGDDFIFINEISRIRNDTLINDSLHNTINNKILIDDSN